MESIELGHFRLLFAGRPNCYGVLHPGGYYAQINEPLTTARLCEHFAGSLVIGAYMITQKNGCYMAVFRPTSPAGVNALVGLQQDLSERSLPSYLEVLPGGMRLWVFLGFWCDTRLLWRALLPLCPPNVKLYPRQDTPTWAHPGAIVRLPLGVYRDGNRYPFVRLVKDQVEPYFTTLEQGLRWFQTVERVSAETLSRLAEENERHPDPPSSNPSEVHQPLIHQSINPSQGHGAVNNPSLIHQQEEKNKKRSINPSQGHGVVAHPSIHQPSIAHPSQGGQGAIQQPSLFSSFPVKQVTRAPSLDPNDPNWIMKWNATQDPLAVIGRYVELEVSERGLGRGYCPFRSHHGGEREDVFSLKVYRPVKPGGFCWWCGVQRKGGTLFTFLTYWHGLDAKDLKRRILSGEQF